MWLKDFFDLIKVRILFSALLTTFFGYSVSLDIHLWDMGDLFWVLLGSGLIFSASASLNHVLEKDVDGLMERTMFRPLPQERFSRFQVVLLVLIFFFLGVMVLFFKTNTLVLLNGIIVFILYDFVYTPLKRVTAMNTFVGAFPGAMPVLSGWFMTYDSLNVFILSILLVLYLWQLPHFFSISWIYRNSYKAANLIMISNHDHMGKTTKVYLGCSTVLFVFSTYLPLFYGDLGGIYTYAVTFLNVALMMYVYKFCMGVDDMIARKILFVTIFYPPFIPVFYVVGELL
ncbi:hypothetical protein DID74_01810 [Candidatus Marinamargulisbacteria bacterium SCGC AG-333-B06]|nr:hypothetical protein DID74_01810 [Candidatus Marinamargulisbacteria bacterium SCGC AG-333-B06]